MTIAFGALAGGLTNSVAIWMLFHPYEPPLLFGRWRVRFFQGAVPKNQPRLAAAIGRTVGSRLLTPDDLTSTFAQGEFREAFDQRLAHLVDEVLTKERGSLRDLIPPEVMDDLDALLEEGLQKHEIVFYPVSRRVYAGFLQPLYAVNYIFLYVRRKACRYAVRIIFIRIQPFWLKKHHVRIFIRKSDNLVLYGRTVPDSRGFYLAGI